MPLGIGLILASVAAAIAVLIFVAVIYTEEHQEPL